MHICVTPSRIYLGSFQLVVKWRRYCKFTKSVCAYRCSKQLHNEAFLGGSRLVFFQLLKTFLQLARLGLLQKMDVIFSPSFWDHH